MVRIFNQEPSPKKGDGRNGNWESTDVSVRERSRTFLEALSTSFLTNMAGRFTARWRTKTSTGSKQAEIGDSFLVSSPEEEAGSAPRPVANFLFRSGIETKPTKARQGRERARERDGVASRVAEEELAFGGQLWSRLVSSCLSALRCVVFTDQ
jgi:hypothetical protein